MQRFKRLLLQARRLGAAGGAEFVAELRVNPLLSLEPLTARLQLLISASLERLIQDDINVLFFVNNEAFPLSE